ncbi:hypothetical protein PAMP_017686 [Pampus punctatissimus]
MTSGDLGLTEGLSQDINQEELDFSDLFLYNPPGDFKDEPGALLHNDTQPPLLVVENDAAFTSSCRQNPSSHSPTTDNLSGAAFDPLGLISRPGTIPAPSPRIEITPSGDSLSSQTLECSPGSKALAAYRECVSPASSNSSTGWPAEGYSPLASPCVSPSNGGGCGMGMSALDLCPGLQGIHTSSAHSSPGASPHNSVTDETYLLPQHQRTASPLPHQRSRSASPQGKRTYDQVHSCQGGTPVKQRSRSPSPIPSPHDQQGSYYLHQYQAQADFQPQAQTSSPVLNDILGSLGACLPRVVHSAVVRGAHGQAQRQDCVYGEGYDWAPEQEKMSRAGAEVKSETLYMLPAVWPPHQVHPGAFSLTLSEEMMLQHIFRKQAQRSAQELPAVEKQDLDRCSVLGGQQMVLTGQNFTSDSKVMFSEKTQDGQQIWEVEATVDRDKTQSNMLFVEVPSYRDQSICHQAKVNFYVINGKKKRSQPQHFIYTPVTAIKTEPLDDYQLNSYGYSDNQSLSGLSMKSLYHHLEQDSNLQALNVSSTLYHVANIDHRAHVSTADPLEDQAVYYQPRAGTLINSPMLYHTANQHYSNCSTAFLCGPPIASHPANATASSLCVSARTPVGKLDEGPQIGDSFEACLMTRQQGFVQAALPLEKSPPSRYIQGQAQGKGGCRLEPGSQHLTQTGRGNYNDHAPERVTVKQENLSYTYLEDVNDIIRRDLKGHNGE